MTDTPTPASSGAMDAARALDGLYREAEPDVRWPAIAHAAEIIQEKAVAPVEAERDKWQQLAGQGHADSHAAEVKLVQALQQRDSARAAVGELRTALEAYCYCRHACIDCFCTAEARAALAAKQQEGEKI